MKGKKDRVFYFMIAGFLILQIAFCAYWGVRKCNFHVDEYFTYGLANNRGAIHPVLEDGTVYSGDDIFLEYLAPDDSECFDYSIIRENISQDAHPPLYYTLIHTICSFFPDSYSKWEGLILNFLLLLLIDGLVYLLANCLLHNRKMALVLTAAYGFCALCVSMVLFIRMYTLMTVFTLAVTLLFTFYYKKKKDIRFWAGLFFLAVGGTMTQYYFLIYLFFLCLVYGILMLMEKNWKDVAAYIGTLALAGIACVLIWPAMLTHILGDASSERGAQAFENAKNLPDLWPHIKSYFNIINGELFGGCLPVLLVLLVIAVIAARRMKRGRRKDFRAATLLCLPGACYCLVIAAIAPYQYDRYIMAVGPILFLGVLCMLFQAARQAVRDPFIKSAAAYVILAAVVILSWRSVGWKPEYIMENTKDRLEIAEEYAEESVIFVYGYSWTVLENIRELQQYQDFTFVKPQDLAALLEERQEDSYVLYCISGLDFNEVSSAIMARDSGTEIEKLYTRNHQAYADIYYVSRQAVSSE